MSGAGSPLIAADAAGLNLKIVSSSWHSEIIEKLISCQSSLLCLANDNRNFTIPESPLSDAFPANQSSALESFGLPEDLLEISNYFGLEASRSPFLNQGFFSDGLVSTCEMKPSFEGPRRTLGDVLQPDDEVPEEFWISEQEIDKWRFLKGPKRVARKSKSGHEYHYSEGGMSFPDSLDKPSRTILTGEGGSSASRFKHVVETSRGLRRLTPVELERLNGFPDNWTASGVDGNAFSAQRRAFLMGNALVVGLIEKIGASIAKNL